LVTECGLVFKSNDFRNIIDLRFVQLRFPKNEEKVMRVAAGSSFVSIMTEQGRCFSSLHDDKNSLVESSKLSKLRVVDINAGAQHVLVSAELRHEDENGNEQQQPMLNQTYTINFKPIKGLGNGEENYQEPDTGESMSIAALPLHCEDITQYEDKLSLNETDGSTRPNGCSRATTLECHDTASSGSNSTRKNSANRSDSTIRYIDNGIDMIIPGECLLLCVCNHGVQFNFPLFRNSTEEEKARIGSVRINIPDDEKLAEDDDGGDGEPKKMPRRKTPMPRNGPTSEDELEESGIVDRDEDLLYNGDDDDDVSTNTLNESTESLNEFVKEENKINADKSIGAASKLKKWKKFMAGVKDKGRGLSCKNTDNVIGENDAVESTAVVQSTPNTKSCSIM